MTWSRFGVERISSGGQWRHWVTGGCKIRNGKWRFGTAIFPIMKVMTTAIVTRRAVAKTREPTPVKEMEPVWPDQRGEDDDNPSEDDDTRALEWLPMRSGNELATDLVSPLSRI